MLQGEIELLSELLATVEYQQFTGVQGIQPQRSLAGLVNQRALRLRSKSRQFLVSQATQENRQKKGKKAKNERADVLALKRIVLGSLIKCLAREKDGAPLYPIHGWPAGSAVRAPGKA